MFYIHMNIYLYHTHLWNDTHLDFYGMSVIECHVMKGRINDNIFHTNIFGLQCNKIHLSINQVVGVINKKFGLQQFFWNFSTNLLVLVTRHATIGIVGQLQSQKSWLLYNTNKQIESSVPRQQLKKDQNKCITSITDDLWRQKTLKLPMYLITH